MRSSNRNRWAGRRTPPSDTAYVPSGRVSSGSSLIAGASPRQVLSRIAQRRDLALRQQSGEQLEQRCRYDEVDLLIA